MSAGKRTPAKAKGKARGSAKAPRKQPALDKREIFIRQYLIHKNASQAYREAGYKDGPGTRQSASALLSSPYVRDRLAEEREKHLSKLDVTVEAVLDRFKAIAFGDAAAITEYVTGCCRFCHGSEHRYQWKTPREFSDAVEAYMSRPPEYHATHAPPDQEGGYGYRFSNPPHPDCPECDGRGIADVMFKPTALMTPDERKLFAGVKVTQHGIEFKMNDQMAALERLAEHVEFYKKRDENNANAIARALAELQDRGAIGRMPLRKDTPAPEEKAP